jgi:hypothetical protein
LRGELRHFACAGEGSVSTVRGSSTLSICHCVATKSGIRCAKKSQSQRSETVCSTHLRVLRLGNIHVVVQFFTRRSVARVREKPTLFLLLCLCADRRHAASTVGSHTGCLKCRGGDQVRSCGILSSRSLHFEKRLRVNPQLLLLFDICQRASTSMYYGVR